MSKVTLKVGEEFEPITKDNIAEVLEYNGLKDTFSGGTNARSIIMGSGTPEWCSANFKNPNWLQIIEAHLGKKLTPLPKKANPFDAVKIGQWVRYVGEDAFETTKNRWYQRIPGNWFVYKTDDDNTVQTAEYEEWDLTDIRDYNPDEEIILKVGDIVKYNNSGEYIIDKIDHANEIIFYRDGSLHLFSSFSESGNEVESVNGKRGKYVIPSFDFVQTLLDNGFQAFGFFICNNTRVSTSPLWFDTITSKFNNFEIKLTPENAKRIIDAANSLKELEIVKWKF